MFPTDPRESGVATPFVGDIRAAQPSAPHIIYFAAALLIIFGIAAIGGMLSDIVRGRFFFDIAVFGLPLGKALLARRPFARQWAVRLCILSLVVDATSTAIVFHNLESNELRRDELWLLAAGILLHASVALVTLVAFRRPDVRAWFDAAEVDAGDSSAWIRPLICLGVLLAAADLARDYHADASFESLYRVQIRFKVRDGNTGQALPSIGHPAPVSVPKLKGPDPLRPRVAMSVFGIPAGSELEVNGFSGRPFTMEFGSAGYLPTSYRVTAESPREVHITLFPDTPGVR